MTDNHALEVNGIASGASMGAIAMADLPFSMVDWIDGELPNVRLFTRLFLGEVDFSAPVGLHTFTEANFIGYEQQELVLDQSVTVFDPNSAFAQSFAMLWRMEEADPPFEMLGGYFVVAQIPDQELALVMAENFAQPFPASADFSPFGLRVSIRSGNFVVRAA